MFFPKLGRNPNCPEKARFDGMNSKIVELSVFTYFKAILKIQKKPELNTDSKLVQCKPLNVITLGPS
jgi:hypothetical protein